MAKQSKAPDDNDLRRRGAALDYLDGIADGPPDPDEPGPRSTSHPAVYPLVSAVEGSEAIARALRSPASLLALRSTAGAGKSAEVRRLVAERTGAGEHALVIVPTHALAGQTVSELAKLRVAASAPMSVARVRLPVFNDQGEAGEAVACLHAESADLLIRSGARVRQVMCAHCDHRKDYQGTGTECPAYAAGGAGGAVVVLQQPVLAAALADHTRRLLGPAPERPEDGPARLIIADELPPITTSTRLDGARTAYKRLRAGEMNETTREAFEPFLVTLLEGYRIAAERGLEGATTRQLVELAGLDPDVIESMLAGARESDGADLWTCEHEANLARLAVQHPGNLDVKEKLERLARLTALFEALVDAAHYPDQPALRADGTGGWHLVTRARWTRRVLPYVEAGGRVRLLDATAPLDALRALWGAALEVVQVDVQDAPGVTRRSLQWQRGARRRHTVGGQADPERLRGPLRTIAAAAAERGARSVAILTDKPTAEGLRAWLTDRAAGRPAPAMVPAELSALVEAGVMLLVGHFGAQRGLDTWAGADMLVTLGDPWPDIGAAQAEALALGLKPRAWARELARAELLQAWGRARAVHRPTPVLVLHLGARVLAPAADWAPQWAEIPVEPPASHRPASVRPPSDPSTWASDRTARSLSARQHAAELGITWATYRRLATAALTGGRSNPLNETAIKGSVEVGHNWPQEVSLSGSSGCGGAPSLIASYGPPQTPTNLGVDGVTDDPDAVPPLAPPRRSDVAPAGVICGVPVPSPDLSASWLAVYRREMVAGSTVRRAEEEADQAHPGGRPPPTSFRRSPMATPALPPLAAPLAPSASLPRAS